MTSEQCKAQLQLLGFVPPLPPAVATHCYDCQGEMKCVSWSVTSKATSKDASGKSKEDRVVKTSREMLRCKDPRCDKHFAADTSHTPLHDARLTWSEYLKLACWE